MLTDKIGRPFKVGDLVCWSSSGYFGGLRLGRVAEIDPQRKTSGYDTPIMVHSVEPYKPGGWKPTNHLIIVQDPEVQPKDWKAPRKPRNKEPN